MDMEEELTLMVEVKMQRFVPDDWRDKLLHLGRVGWGRAWMGWGSGWGWDGGEWVEWDGVWVRLGGAWAGWGMGGVRHGWGQLGQPNN